MKYKTNMNLIGNKNIKQTSGAYIMHTGQVTKTYELGRTKQEHYWGNTEVNKHGGKTDFHRRC